ncbi:MAG: EVE domain-containing protein [Oligoflexales bacterium]|nr:EVE domain-containing protein [Oligoflexales bacterium]
MSKYWLVKSEPSTYSFSDLKRDGHTVWEGVRNFQARNFMKEMKLSDLVLFYHSNCDDKGVFGLAKVVREAYPDPSAQNPKSDYYDERSLKNPNFWLVVDLAWAQDFQRSISLAEMKEVVALHDMRLVRKGNRLSVLPVEKAEFDCITKMGLLTLP